MTTAITPNASERIVIDSSAWLEYLTDDVNAQQFAPYIEGDFVVVVPTMVVYEVYRKLLTERGRTTADSFASEAARHTVLVLDDALAIRAALLSTDHHLAMADAIIYASAVAQEARLITGDTHFNGLPGVIIP
jgi:predicted nucleic acid-binding protein